MGNKETLFKGSIMYLNKKLNIWECSSCGRRLGAWITKYTA